jgi:hypothetical protein
MNKQILLQEYYALCEGGVCQDLLTEREKQEMRDGSALYLTGVMQRADAKNGNGRVYSIDILKREAKNYNKLIKEKRALGELDHPESSVVNLQNCSHLVTEVWFDGNDMMGKIKALSTPSGEILKSLIKSGVQVGISSRGLGSVEERSGNTYVQEDFQLICFDIVADPSTKGAFMKPTMRESKDFMSRVFTKADRINRALNSVLEE